MKLKEIEKKQNKNLRKFIRIVYNFHPYYRRLFKSIGIKPSDIKTKKDLEKIPFTYKNTWSGQEDQFILRPNKRISKFLSMKDKLTYLVNRKKVVEKIKSEYQPATFFATSGRTSSPSIVFYTRYDIEKIKNHTIRSLDPVKRGLRYNLRTQVVFPYAPHLAFWHTAFAWLGEPNAFGVFLGAGRTNVQLEIMERMKTNLLVGIPSYVRYLSEMAVEKKIKSSVKYIVLGGEYLPGSMRKRIIDNFSSIGPEPKVIQTYASTEMKLALFEDLKREGYIIDPTSHIWEVVDPKTGEQLDYDEEGMLVFTHLDTRGTTLLRYWTNDIADNGIFFDDGNLKISREIHRVSDEKELVTKVKGTLINLMTLEDLINSMREIKEYQIVLTKDKKKLDQMVIRLSLKKRYEKIREKIELKIQNLVRDYYEITPRVQVVKLEKLVEEIFEKLKGMHVIDLRNV